MRQSGKPRLLDLFCGPGLGADGYVRAGWEVIGVDLELQPHYPYAFVQMDSLDYLEALVETGWGHDSLAFDAIHASPPCQFASDYGRTGLVHKDHENLIPATRELIEATGLPYVIENVEKARRWLRDPLMLCGSSFDLDVKRHRLFETNRELQPPEWPCRHGIWSARFPAATNRASNSRRTVEIGVRRIPLEVQKRAMGVRRDVTREELSQGIPPAYTELIGHQLMQHVEAKAAA